MVLMLLKFSFFPIYLILTLIDDSEYGLSGHL